MHKRRLTLTSILILWTAASLCAQDAPESLTSRFQRLDTDQNGKLSPAEFKHQRIFRLLDRNRDGQIEFEEASRFTVWEQDRQRPEQEAVYGQHPKQKLDVYLPQTKPTRGQVPVMVYVHGGGWKIGDKRAVGQKARFFTELGWAFVSVNYRLLPDGKHPNNVKDIAGAIDWVLKNTEKLKLDPQQLFLMGHSAGSHLVSLVATDERHLKQLDRSLSDIRGVIALDTIAYDVTTLPMTGKSVYREVFGTEQARQRDASPLNFVQSDKSIPPFLICYSRGMGVRKNPSRPKAAQAFAEKLKQAGISATVVDASDRNHSEINQWFGKPDDSRVTGRAQSFLQSILEEKQQTDEKS